MTALLYLTDAYQRSMDATVVVAVVPGVTAQDADRPSIEGMEAEQQPEQYK